MNVSLILVLRKADHNFYNFLYVVVEYLLINLKNAEHNGRESQTCRTLVWAWPTYLKLLYITWSVLLFKVSKKVADLILEKQPAYVEVRQHLLFKNKLFHFVLL